MANWSLPNIDNQINEFDYQFPTFPPHQGQMMMPPPPPPPPRAAYTVMPPPAQVQPSASTSQQTTNEFLQWQQQQDGNAAADGTATKRESPREMRNRAEKKRRDRLNQSVAELQAMVPQVIAHRKADKTTVLRLSAHYLRANKYVFGDTIDYKTRGFRPDCIMSVLNLFNGFLITVTYRGLIVVVSPHVYNYLRYTELDLLGHNLLKFTHEEDRPILKDQLMPRSQKLGCQGEILISDEPGAISKVNEELAQEKRQFTIRLRKNGHRAEPAQYVRCQIEGTLRKSDKACTSSFRGQIVRRARARSENPCSSGNDIVFVGMVRPTTETFMNERALEYQRMEYRTRHSIDGQIMQSDSRMALVTGYLMHEVSGMNAMNFMHREDVHWVVIALRDMYDNKKVFGESCYRLMTKNGKFIYLKTRGRLDVDVVTGACTSFICTNTEVSEKEGKELIENMKKKYALIANKMDFPTIGATVDEINEELNNTHVAPVEDPRRLEKIILNLVTDIPSTPPETPCENTSWTMPSTSNLRIKIIPPTKENIVSAIKKIYDVIYSLPKHPSIKQDNCDLTNRRTSCPSFEGIFKDNKIIKLGSNNSNETFDSGENSYSSYNRAQSLAGTRNFFIPETAEDPVCFTNFGYLESINRYSNLSCSNINAISKPTYSNGDERRPEFHATDTQMDFFTFEELQQESNFVQNLSEPNTTYFPSGSKRQFEFENQDYLNKKKNTEVESPSELFSSDSQNLESFFEEFFNTQIDSAINSLDGIDPSFPDLLVATDVQDILRQLESEQNDEKPQE